MSIEAIKEALKAGPTEGPWLLDGQHVSRAPGFHLYVECLQGSGGKIVGSPRANAAFIAACNPAAIQALIERLEAAEKAAARYRVERDHSRACYESSIKLLTGIHSLLYPAPTTTPDGRVMVFRPNGLDPHEIMQCLSDRIRAIPDELAKSEKQSGGLAEGVSK